MDAEQGKVESLYCGEQLAYVPDSLCNSFHLCFIVKLDDVLICSRYRGGNQSLDKFNSFSSVIR